MLLNGATSLSRGVETVMSHFYSVSAELSGVLSHSLVHPKRRPEFGTGVRNVPSKLLLDAQQLIVLG